MQLRATQRLATPAAGVVGVGVDLLAGSAAQFLLERLPVDDDVDQRLGGTAVAGGAGTAEDLEQGVGPALGRRPPQVLDPGIGSVRLAGLGPVGVELGVLVAVEQFLHRRALEGTVVAL